MQDLISWKVHVTLYQDTPALCPAKPCHRKKRDSSRVYRWRFIWPGTEELGRAAGTLPLLITAKVPRMVWDGSWAQSLCVAGKGATALNLSPPATTALLSPPSRSPHPLALSQLEARPNRKRKLRHCMGTTKPKGRGRYVETMATFWLG